jgi:hypothetical protein
VAFLHGPLRREAFAVQRMNLRGQTFRQILELHAAKTRQFYPRVFPITAQESAASQDFS